MISHDEIKAKALAEIGNRWFMRRVVGNRAEDVAENIANAMVYDNTHYRSTGATESARQMMTERIGERTKELCASDDYGFDPITLFLIGILINALIRVLIDWYFTEQAEQARQEH